MAAEVFTGLYKKDNKEDIHLYLVLAEIRKITSSWNEDNSQDRGRLIELIEQLDLLRDNKQYKSNIKLVAMLYLESAYNLGINAKEYLEAAIERYMKFTEEVKEDPTVKYLYALCVELNGGIDAAENIYAELDWSEDANIACRYLICKLLRNKYAEVMKVFDNINRSVINTKLKSLYLTAVFYNEKGRYEDTLKNFLMDAQNDIGEIIDIAFGIREERYLEEYIVPLIKQHLA